MHGMIPSYMIPSNSSNKILVWNDYNEDINVLFSDNQINWDTIVIKRKSGQLVTASKKFSRIFTNTIFQDFVLEKSTAYVIFWDRTKKLWLIIKYAQ